MSLFYHLPLSPLQFLFPLPPYFSFHFPFLPTSSPFLLFLCLYPFIFLLPSSSGFSSFIHSPPHGPSSFSFLSSSLLPFFLILFHVLHFISISVLTFTVVHLESGRVRILWFAAFAIILEGIILISLMTLHV
jgi:hypothetical protein